MFAVRVTDTKWSVISWGSYGNMAQYMKYLHSILAWCHTCVRNWIRPLLHWRRMRYMRRKNLAFHIRIYNTVSTLVVNKSGTTNCSIIPHMIVVRHYTVYHMVLMPCVKIYNFCTSWVAAAPKTCRLFRKKNAFKQTKALWCIIAYYISFTLWFLTQSFTNGMLKRLSWGQLSTRPWRVRNFYFIHIIWTLPTQTLPTQSVPPIIH